MMRRAGDVPLGGVREETEVEHPCSLVIDTIDSTRNSSASLQDSRHFFLTQRHRVDDEDLDKALVRNSS